MTDPEQRNRARMYLARACRALGELIAEKTNVEYTHRRISEAKVQVLVRRAETLVEVARGVLN